MWQGEHLDHLYYHDPNEYEEYRKLTVKMDAVGYDQNTPDDAVVCPQCWGGGELQTGMETFEDCPVCDCNGWIVEPF